MEGVYLAGLIWDVDGEEVLGFAMAWMELVKLLLVLQGSGFFFWVDLELWDLELSCGWRGVLDDWRFMGFRNGSYGFGDYFGLRSDFLLGFGLEIGDCFD